MMNYIAKLYRIFTCLLRDNKNYLHLEGIYQENGDIICKFNELLRTDGKLIEYNIKEIASNPNIQESISRKTLFIIGIVYGQNQSSLSELRVKVIDIHNNTTTLENSMEQVIIKINDLLKDEALIRKINPLDIVKLIFPYANKLGYNMASSIYNDSHKESALDQAEATPGNIVNLF